MKTIKSHNHITTSCKRTNYSRSCFDNKKKKNILKDGITTLAYGHLVGGEI